MASRDRQGGVEDHCRGGGVPRAGTMDPYSTGTTGTAELGGYSAGSTDPCGVSTGAGLGIYGATRDVYGVPPSSLDYRAYGSQEQVIGLPGPGDEYRGEAGEEGEANRGVDYGLTTTAGMGGGIEKRSEVRQ